MTLTLLPWFSASMSPAMYQYHRALSTIARMGIPCPVQRGSEQEPLAQLVAPMGMTIQMPLLGGVFFPYLQTRPFSPRLAIEEIRWMLQGGRNVKSLHEKKVYFWDPWAKEDGDLGPVYGAQWRDFDGMDQIKAVLAQLEKNGYTRRALVSAWNPPQLDEMALPPCHFSWQAFTLPPFPEDQEVFWFKGSERDEMVFQYMEAAKKKKRLYLHVFMRSWDLFLGGPFNMAGYAFLCAALAEALGFCAECVVIHASHVHIYSNQLPFVEKLIENYDSLYAASMVRPHEIEGGYTIVSPPEGDTSLEKLLSFGMENMQITVPMINFNKDDFKDMPVFV